MARRTILQPLTQAFVGGIPVPGLWLIHYFHFTLSVSFFQQPSDDVGLAALHFMQTFDREETYFAHECLFGMSGCMLTAASDTPEV